MTETMRRPDQVVMISSWTEEEEEWKEEFREGNRPAPVSREPSPDRYFHDHDDYRVSCHGFRISLGDRVFVTKGKWSGCTGKIASFTKKRVRVEFDEHENVTTCLKDDRMIPLQPRYIDDIIGNYTCNGFRLSKRDRVFVTKGKYEGCRATVMSFSPKLVRVEIRDYEVEPVYVLLKQDRLFPISYILASVDDSQEGPTSESKAESDFHVPPTPTPPPKTEYRDLLSRFGLHKRDSVRITKGTYEGHEGQVVSFTRKMVWVRITSRVVPVCLKPDRLTPLGTRYVSDDDEW